MQKYLLLSLFLAAPAAAQDIIITATGIAQPATQTGQSITVIDAAEIERRQLPAVAELLATVPGVRFSRSGPEGGVTGVSIRGAETTQTLVLIDGVKVNDPSGIGDMFDFGNLMTGNIQRIEVLRGANAIPHGSQAIGGVVAVSSAPTTESLSGGGSIDYGWRDTLTGKADIAAGNAVIGARLGVAGFRTDGISAASEARGATEQDGFRNLAVNGRVDIRPADAVSIELVGWHIDSHLNYDSFFGPPADSPDLADTRQWIGQVALNLALFDGVLSNRLAVSFHDVARDYYFAPADKPDYGYGGRTWRFSYKGEATPAGPVRLVFGYDHEAPRYTAFGFGDAEASAKLDSVHAIAIVEPARGLTLTGGVRHDHHSLFGGATSFSADAAWAVGRGTRLRAAYGEGFKAPSLYQLFDSFSGDRDLKPERARSYEAGIEHDTPSGAASFYATAFHRDTRYQINFDNNTWLYGNLDRTRAQGLELGARLRPAEGLLLDAGYSHVNARNRAPQSADFGRRLARRAADAAHVSVDQRFANGLSAGATVRLVGASFEDAANTVRLAPYVVAGLRASAPIARGVEIYGRIDNLFDEQYETAFGYGTQGRSAFAGVRFRM